MPQQTVMKFDPATGTEKPYPSHAQQWRDYHGHATAWLVNPWSGERRSAQDVGSDPQGLLIIPQMSASFTAYETEEFGRKWEALGKQSQPPPFGPGVQR